MPDDGKPNPREVVDMNAKWECKAVSKERGALERARDARRTSGDVWNGMRELEFNRAHDAFRAALSAHVAETGCTDMH